MKPFIIKLFIFLIIPLIVTYVSLIILNKKNTQLINNYRTKTNINTLILGDSHTEATVIDSLYPNAQNISQTGEGYIYTYCKLATILKNNPNIKTIILGYGYHNISQYFDFAIFGNNSISTYSNFYCVLSEEQRAELNSKNQLLFYKSLIKIYKNGIKNIVKEEKDYSFLGSYVSTKTDKFLDSLSVNRRVSAQYYDGKNELNFSEINIKYLVKIIELCKNKNINLYLFKTPLSKIYATKVPQKFKSKYDELLKKNKCTLIDFSKLDLDNNLFLPDGDHLRYSGAVKTTTILFNTIRNKEDSLYKN